MMWKAGNSYGINYNEEKNSKMPGWPQPTLFEVRRNKELSREPRGGLMFGDWLTGYIVSGQEEHLWGRESYLSFS